MTTEYIVHPEFEVNDELSLLQLEVLNEKTRYFLQNGNLILELEMGIVSVDGVGHLVYKNSMFIEYQIEQRSVARFAIIDKNNEYDFERGQSVRIGQRFNGLIHESNFRKVNKFYIHEIIAVDRHRLADKRIIAKAYKDTTTGAIVQDIIANYLSAEGVGFGDIAEGTTKTQAVFNYIRCTDALDVLAEESNYWWEIDAQSKLHFLPKEAKPSEIPINADTRISGIQVKKGQSKYRNKQYVRGGKALTNPQTEEVKGDGTTKVFVLSYPIAEKPRVLVGGVEQQVGIRGLEDGKAWYWNKGDKVISQDFDAEPLPTGTIAEVTYRGQIDIVTQSFDTAEITARQEIEGGTGIYESVHDNPSIEGRAAAFQIGEGLLNKYMKEGRNLRFIRYEDRTWSEGELVDVNLPEYKINNVQMLVESYTERIQDNIPIYEYNLVEGPTFKSWESVFYEMSKDSKSNIIRENILEDETLVTAHYFSKTWTQAEQPNIYASYPADGTYTAGDARMPSFEEQHRTTHIAWLDEFEVEIGRKAVTITDAETPGQMQTTTYLDANEANGQIHYLAWIGGHTATADPGTGVVVDIQPFDKLKTELEALQIVKTDTKGW